MRKVRAGSPVAQAIVTLTLNPALDLCFEIDRLAPTRKLRGDHLRRDPGGGGINVARVVQRLGGTATAVFPAGGPTGERLRGLLAAEGLRMDVVPVSGETRESFAATERSSARQYRFVLPGERLTAAERDRVLRRVEARLRGALLVASGSAPPGTPRGFYARLAAKARAAGARLALDASGDALADGLSRGVWLVKPNVDELETLVGAALPEVAGRLEACQRLVTERRAELVALSMGPEGALLVAAGGAWRADAPPVEAISAVGAGDSFVGGLVWAFATGASAPEALRWAVAAGSAALLAPGVQLCRASDVRRLRRAVSVKPL